MKKIFCTILAMILCISLGGCNGGRNSAKSVVEDALKAFQSADSTAIQQYWKDTDFMVGTSESDVADEEFGQKLLELFAENMTYAITDSDEDENAGTAVVTVEITNIDMSAVLPDWVRKVFSQLMGYVYLPENQQPSEEELNQLYMECLNNAIVEHLDDRKLHIVDISLTLVENEWKIETSETVADAMVGGMITQLANLDESIAETAATVEPLRSNPAVLGDYTVEIQSGVITEDYEGEPAVVIDYTWTNNSSETTSPFLSVSIDAFQDGIGLQSAFILNNDIYDGSMSMTDVRPGTTITVQAAFKLNNTTSPVEVEITEAFKWGKTTKIAFKRFLFQ